VRFHRPRRSARVAAIDLTPMVDVVFQLIIFFMLTARSAQEARPPLDLPPERGREEESAESAGLVLSIEADGDLLIGRTPIDLDDLSGIIRDEADRRHGGDRTAVRVTVRADRRALTDRLNEVVRALRQQGIGGAGLATEAPTGGRGP